MIVPQRSRTKKGNTSSKSSRRRNSLTNGAVPLEPIFEHADMSPLEEYMSDTILKRIRLDDGTCSDSSSSEDLSEEGSSSSLSSSSSCSSQFQIITDNASSHPEFIVRQSRTTNSHSHSKSQQQQQSPQQMPTCRWGNGDCVHPNKIGNDSNTSINTASTSSLSIWLNDCEDDDSDGDTSVDSFTNESSNNNHNHSSHNSSNNMTSTQIIQQATDVVAGKYDYNNHHNNTTSHGVSRRRQARRSSMPLMPIRQESISHDLGQPSSGLPPPPLRPSKNVRSTSLTSSPPPSSQPLDLSRYRDPSSHVPVDKFGIPVRFGTSSDTSHNSNNSSNHHSGHSRRRRERRSSMPSRADEVHPVSSTEVWLRHSEPSGEKKKKDVKVDKFGIPLTQEVPLESCSAHGPRSRRTVHRRRSSDGDATPKQVDKYGIPLTKGTPLESSSAHGTRCTGPRRHGRRSSLGDKPSSGVAPPKQQEETLKVDKYGIPLTTKDTSTPGRRRQGRRSSMPTTTTSTSTTATATRSVTFDLPQEEEEEEVPLAPESGSVPVDKFGIPIWPTEMRNSSTGRRRRKPRRSSLPTTGTGSSSNDASSPVVMDKYGVPVTTTSSKPNRSGRRGRRSSMPKQFSPASTDHANLSAMRFLSEELLQKGGNPMTKNNNLRRNTPLKKKKDGLAPANGAPKRPERVPSVDSFAPTTKTNNFVAAAQPNASFDVKKKINHKKLESILKGSSSTTGSSSKKTTGSISSSDVSVNSMQQKDGEWWW